MLRYIRKADIILIAALIALGVVATVFLSRADSTGKYAVVHVRGEMYGKYKLSEDQTIDLGTGNVLSVRDGKVKMKSATCHGKDCLRQGSIDSSPHSIICLPHKVSVTIEGEDREYDTIAK